MDDEDFAGIISGLNDVKDYYEGKREGFVVHEPVDVKAVRAVTKLSQASMSTGRAPSSDHIAIGSRTAVLRISLPASCCR